MQRKTTLLSLFAAVAFGSAAAGFVGCTSILGDFEVAGVSPEGGAAGAKKNGEVCASGGDCESTFCADGVCCESACSGVCETCGADKGKCTPIPDGTDPDKECLPEPRPDAGPPPPPDPDGGLPDPDGGTPEGGALEGGAPPEDGGGIVNVPDGGFTQSDAPCAGSCNGARACKFPDKATTCGTKFCNDSTQAGRFACDGKGRCELGLETCASFSCENDECRKTCAEQNDCQSTHFCNTSGVCQERLANGLACGNPDQCKSGFCVVEGGAGVCCNSECDASLGIPGATCKKAGSVGKCQCSLACGAGSCRLYYRDSDGDTFGDKDGTVAANTAALGCDNAAPPAGFVASKTDCDDGDARAKPGQTDYFADTTLGKGLRDFNCSGAIEKETPEYPGATCQFCYGPGKGNICSSTATCSAKGDQSRLSCGLYKSICFPAGTCYTCGYGRGVTNTYGFAQNVDCGDSALPRSCGQCSAAGGGPPLVFTTSVTQRCH